MIYLKVSLILGGDPYDQARIDGIETFVRDAIADGLMLEHEHVEVERLPCGFGMGAGHYWALCARPSGHNGGHGSAHDNDDWRDHLRDLDRALVDAEGHQP